MFQLTLIPSNPLLDGSIIYVREPITAEELLKWQFHPFRDLGTDNAGVVVNFIAIEQVSPDTYVHPDDCRDTFTEWLEEWERGEG